MGFTTAVSTALRKYATFSGRARRSEFWWFYLFANVVALLGLGVDLVLGTDTPDGGGVVAFVAVLALLLPYLAVSVRRLHDTDRTGWWLLIGVIPVIGTIVLLVFYVLDSTPGGNRFGPSPKQPSPVGSMA